MSQLQIQVTYIPVHEIQPSPLNPRKHFDEESIKELASSIKAEGVLQPILVRLPIGGMAYEIVAGERRHRASTLAGLETIPCIIRELNDEEALEIMITENLQRKDIHPMEEAAGFKQLIAIKHMDVQEIALRVGKSPAFVAQRLKLNDLIEPMQECFFRGLLLVKGALILSQMKPEDQQVIYDERLEGRDSLYEPSKWDLRKYRHNLSDAPFNTMDASLLKGKPSCQVCPMNSAAALLFTDLTEPVCNDSACYRAKCERSFEIELKAAQEDPSVVLITDQYNPDSDTKKLMAKVNDVLEYNNYTEIHEPDKPDFDEDFEGCYDTAEEERQEFAEAMERYERDLVDFKQKTESGGYTRAFKVGGDDKGRYTWVKLKKGAKAAGKSSLSPEADTSDNTISELKDEIQRIKDREARAKQLDQSKIWDQVKPYFDPIKATQDFTDLTLTPVELRAAAHAIWNKMDWQTRNEFEEHMFGHRNVDRKAKKLPPIEIEEYFDGISQLGVNELLRVFFLDTLPPGQIYHGIDGDAAVMMDVAKAYWPTVVQDIITNQGEVAEKRAKRVDQKLADLEAKLKDAKKIASNAKKLASKANNAAISTEDIASETAPAAKGVAGKSKRGKGIKSLIAQPEEA